MDLIYELQELKEQVDGYSELSEADFRIKLLIDLKKIASRSGVGVSFESRYLIGPAIKDFRAFVELTTSNEISAFVVWAWLDTKAASFVRAAAFQSMHLNDWVSGPCPYLIHVSLDPSKKIGKRAKSAIEERFPAAVWLDSAPT